MFCKIVKPSYRALITFLEAHEDAFLEFPTISLVFLMMFC